VKYHLNKSLLNQSREVLKNRKNVANLLDISMDVLRNWERNGLISATDRWIPTLIKAIENAEEVIIQLKKMIECTNK